MIKRNKKCYFKRIQINEGIQHKIKQYTFKLTFTFK